MVTISPTSVLVERKAAGRNGNQMTDTILCSECGTSFSAMCPACRRAAQPALSASDEEQDFILVYDATVAISPELDQIDQLDTGFGAW
jgi:hypothetical protein